MKRSILSALFLAVLCPLIGFGQKPTYVRKNAHSIGAQADIQAMSKALKLMRKLPCDNPVSWYYQGAIHHVPDPLEITGPNYYCPQYKTTADTLLGWDTCPHMQPGFVQYHFLTWHRLYIYYYEKIIRKLSGKKDFALPYWNYNVPAQRTMPTGLRLPKDTTINGLYEVERSPTLMAGQSINNNAKDGIVKNVNGKIVVDSIGAMGYVLDPDYLWNSYYIKNFSSELEDGPHNVIHDYVGGAVNPADTLVKLYNRIYQSYNFKDGSRAYGLMADVPSAGFDPIFFFHHANIDRLWAEWEKRHYELSWDEFQKAGWWPYVFFDENGKKVVYKSMKEVYEKIRNIDYTYDYMLAQPKLLAANKVSARFSEESVLGTVSANKSMVEKYNSFEVNSSKKLVLLAGADKSKKVYSLEVEIGFQKQTKTKLVVMLNDDKAKKLSREPKKYIVGIVGLFGANSHHQASSGHSGHGAHAGFTKTLRFDITDELAAQAASGDKFKVSVFQLRPEPKNPITVKSVTVKEISRL